MDQDRSRPGESPDGRGLARRAPGSRHDAERQADEITGRAARSAPPVDGRGSGPVPLVWRRAVEEATGADLSDVHLDPTTTPRSMVGGPGTVAAFHDGTVFTGLGGALAGTELGRDIVVHELAHAAQEQVADRAGDGRRFRALGPLQLDLCRSTPTGTSTSAPPVVDPLDTLRSGKALSATDAKALLDHYESLGGSDRDAVVTQFHKVGAADSGVQRLLAAADPAEVKARRALVSDIQERVQRLAVEQTAGKTITALGAEQGAFMKSEAEKLALAEAAAAAKAKKAPPPKSVSAAEVAKAHEKATKLTSPVTKTVTNAWDALGAPAQATWNTRAAAVITKVVDACKTKAPELGITAANLKWAPKEVAAAGSNVYAFSGDPLSFGMGFVETAEADPEYPVRIVVHEIAGHPEFGDRYTSAEALIYAEAHTSEPALGTPWDTEEETNTFGYLGTEIYAALREVPYDKPLTKAHAKKGLITAIDPEANIDNKIGLVRSKYAPKVGEAVIQGLYERFRVDPRVSASALTLFVKLAEKHFPKVLKT